MKKKADAILAASSTMEQSGDVQSIGLPTLLPGYNMYIMNPYCALVGLKYISGLTHTFDSRGFIIFVLVFLPLQKSTNGPYRHGRLFGCERSAFLP